MGLNYPIILQSRFSGRKDKAATPLREKDGQVWRRLDGGPGIRGGGEAERWGERVGDGGWLRMRDGRSKTAPIINHRMIHSIVPSPLARARARARERSSFVPSFLLKTRSRRESSSFLERDHLCCRERARLVLAKEAIYHPWNPAVPATHLTPAISPPPLSLSLSLSLFSLFSLEY